MSRTRCLTLTFGDRGVMPISSAGFEYFVPGRHAGTEDSFDIFWNNPADGLKPPTLHAENIDG